LACTFPVNPDQSDFSCTTDADCGSDWVCVVQRAPGPLFELGVCFPSSQCTAETCNGKDDDCDGVVDDNLAAEGTPCETTAEVCNAGFQVCQAGAWSCVGQVLKQPEACDGVTDLDCNGLVGCADPACEGKPACGVGCLCADGGNRETNCADGIDNNGNGLTDCQDPDCLGQTGPCGGVCLSDGGCE
jgi:hypothetical protein